MEFKLGCWISNGKKFGRKYDALHYASANNFDVKFYYHNKLWNQFDRSFLGKTSLNELYRIRALQLREKYDYLILYYSAGSDSHQVLRTFIDNNIKLDEVCVKWPKILRDGKFYTPNNKDKSTGNFWSEWNYSVKPSLEWLAKTHPEIKINLLDYAGEIDNINVEQSFEKLNFVRCAILLQNNPTSNSEIAYLDKEKTVGHIYGVDKPLLFLEDKDVFMFFSDVGLDQVGTSGIGLDNEECFYWTPDLPELPFEQAYQLALYYQINKDKRQFLFTPETITEEDKAIKVQFQNDLTRSLLYYSWDNRFQAEKPTLANRRDKFFWFFESPEFERLRQIYNHELSDRISGINSNLLLDSSNGKTLPVYRPCTTSRFYVTTLSD